MTINLLDVLIVLVPVCSTLALIRLFDRWLARQEFREVSRYSDDNIAEYAARRDALAAINPDFLTFYARRVRAWETIKAAAP